MKKWLVLFALCLSVPAYAQSDEAACQAKAVSKEGKALSGAARNSFVKKCVAEMKQASCEERAVSKDGKKLSGAAKNSFMKKCEASAG